MPVAIADPSDARLLTVDDLAAKFGFLPAWRIRTDVPPGTATEEDVERIRCQTDVLCELIDGVLVEKAVSGFTSLIGFEIAGLLREFVKQRRLGWVLGADHFVWFTETQLRAPDVAFIGRDAFPGGKYPRDDGYHDVVLALTVEVISPGNTRKEMELKRELYLASGTELVWLVYPKSQTIEVATSLDNIVELCPDDTLTGDPVLPGFSVKVSQIFNAGDLSET